MHGYGWTGESLAGWTACQKFDGWRCLWTGAGFVTRIGRTLPAPAWFCAGLPGGFPLDGELVHEAGRNSIATAVANGWHGLAWLVFDAPQTPGDFPQRLAVARHAVANAPHAQAVAAWTVEGTGAVMGQLAQIQASGGEGIMCHEPRASYRRGRQATLLKLK
jgi:DNA ligase-1